MTSSYSSQEPLADVPRELHDPLADVDFTAGGLREFGKLTSLGVQRRLRLALARVGTARVEDALGGLVQCLLEVSVVAADGAAAAEPHVFEAQLRRTAILDVFDGVLGVLGSGRRVARELMNDHK